MTPDVFLQRIVDPTLKAMAGVVPVTDQARVLVMTIAGQESNWRARRQIGGPARGYWQFEKFGGVAEVMGIRAPFLQDVCKALDIPYGIDTLFEAMAWNDELACTMARLLLWQDPAALPAIGDKNDAWRYYLRNWRPGAPHPEAWSGYYDQSLAAMKVKP